MAVLVGELLDAGHDVQWFVAPIDIDHAEVARLRVRGAKVLRLPAPPRSYLRVAGLRRRIDRFVGGEKSLSDCLSEFRPGHIFINDGGTWSGADAPLYELLQSNAGRYSIISHLNHPRPPFSHERLERARNLADNAARFYFNSIWSKSLAEEQVARPITSARSFQLPLRHDVVAPLPWPESSDSVRLGIVGRIDAHHKGLDIAVHTMAQLKKAGIKARLAIVGHGPDEAYLRELISFCGAEDCVELGSYTSDLEGFWRDQELCLLPSRYEGLGVTMLEAMSFGRPVLRTPYGGCEEWIDDGANGFVCPASEVAMLVETLKCAIAVRDKWREMGLAAHAKIKRDLDPRPGRVFLEALQPTAEH